MNCVGELAMMVFFTFPFLTVVLAHVVSGCMAHFMDELTSLDGTSTSVKQMRAQIYRFDYLSKAVAAYGHMFAGILAAQMILVRQILLHRRIVCVHLLILESFLLLSILLSRFWNVM